MSQQPTNDNESIMCPPSHPMNTEGFRYPLAKRRQVQTYQQTQQTLDESTMEYKAERANHLDRRERVMEKWGTSQS